MWESFRAEDPTCVPCISRWIIKKWEIRASLVAQLVKNPPAMWETCVRPLAREDPLEKEKAPHSSSGLENPTNCIAHGVAELDMTERLSLHFSKSNG